MAPLPCFYFMALSVCLYLFGGGGTLLPLDDREVREARDHAGHFSVSLVTSECPAQSLTQTKGSMKV